MKLSHVDRIMNDVYIGTLLYKTHRALWNDTSLKDATFLC